MKVALLGPYPLQSCAAPGDASVPGGVDAVVLALARGLAQRSGIELQVITADPGIGAPTTYPGEGYVVTAVPHPRLGRATGHRQVIANLRAAIAAFAPDIVHAHIAGLYGLASLDSGWPSLITLHGIIEREMRQAWAWSSWPVRLRWYADARLERAVVRRAADMIAISPYVEGAVQAGPDARFHLVENPVDDAFFGDAPPPPGAERVVCVARVIPRKGIIALVEAFARVVAVRPRATLLIAGEVDTNPAYADLCRRRTGELGLDHAVTFAGAASREAVLDHLRGCDVFALASEQETASVSISEAMAAGRAVVTTDVGGCRWMVKEGVTGRVVPAKDPVALGDAIAAALGNPALTAAMGEEGRREAEKRFRLSSIVSSTLDVYEEVIGRARVAKPGQPGGRRL